MAKFDKFKLKIDLALKEKNTYEALQVYRTIKNRCRGQVQALECLDLLFDGVQHFSKEKEDTTVIDLAEVYADTLVAFEVKPSDKIYSQIGSIVNLLPANLSKPTETSTLSNSDLRSKVTNDIFKWSRETSTHPFRRLRGDPALHKIFGNVHWAQGAHNVARLHFLLANDPEEFAKFLIDYTTNQDATQEDESDNFGAQAVLQLLTYKKLHVAECFFAIYCRDHPQIRQTFPFKKSPLLNFIWLLLTVLQHQNFNHFVYLLEKYNPILDSDCEYKSHLDKIAQLYFKVPSKSQGSGGMFGELLKGFLPSSTEAIKDDYPADEEMPLSAQKLSASLVEQHSLDFDTQNTAADKGNPAGLIQEPDMFEDALPNNGDTNEATAPTEMDLD